MNYNYKELDEFLKKYGDENPEMLRLRFLSEIKEKEKRDSLNFYILQVDARKRFKRKFHNLLDEYQHFLFPSVLAGEQASDESVSAYHALIAKKAPEAPFSHFIDMTAGLGVDFVSIGAALNEKVKCRSTALELDPLKAEILDQNIKLLKIPLAKVINIDSINYLKSMESNIDLGCVPFERNIPGQIQDHNRKSILIFVDPARRDGENNRIYNPKDCMPDVVGNLDLLRKNADVILIKISPMVEPKSLMTLFEGIRKIHIISKRKECKEILVEIARNDDFEGLRIVNIDSDKTNDISIFEISKADWENRNSIRYIDYDLLINQVSSQPDLYLYEPDAGIMKAAPWGFICKKFEDLYKLSSNTHIFLSPRYHKDFPGRITRICSCVKKSEKKRLKGEQINIVCRNYPDSPDSIAKELKIRSSSTDERFLYCLSVNDSSLGKEHPMMILTTKINHLGK